MERGTQYTKIAWKPSFVLGLVLALCLLISTNASGDPDTTPPSIVQYPTVDHASDTIDVTFSEPVASERIGNGGMELDTNWNNWSFEGAESNVWTSAQNYGGSYSRELVADGDDDGIISSTFATTTGNDYEITFWVYPVDNSVVRFYVRAGDNQSHDGSAWINGTRVQGGLVLNQWNQVTTTYTEAGGGNSAYIILSSYAGGGTYYFDDISIKDVSGSGSSENATTEANYTFSPSMLFNTLGGSDDITHMGNNTYRLSMASVPNNMIFTMTVSNVTDEAGNPLTSDSIRINDDDNDGLPDDWETSTGVGTWNEDPDSDSLNNLEEFNNFTNPNDSDTDGDTLPDGWEVTYGLDPTDDTGVNGGDGDFDGDGWTNYEEYVSNTDPGTITASLPAPPEIARTIPRHNSGITNTKRVPTATSFAVMLQDENGIDLTDTASIRFTINDGANPVYVRDLSDSSVFRVTKLTTDADTEATKLWAVYDRSKDTYGSYPYDANVNIRVDAKDNTGLAMDQASFDFNIESSSEQMTAQNNEPDTSTVANSPAIGLTTESIDSGILEGAKVIYDSSEPIQPKFGPVNEVPIVSGVGVTPAHSSYPINLEPPTVFNNPVTIFVPIPKTSDVSSPTDDLSTLSIALYDGESWMVACDANGNVTPAGDGWMVPGSRVNHSQGFPPSIELQVYHFSAIQAAVVTGGSASSLDASALSAGGGGGGGCFIGSMGKGMNGQKILVLLMTLALAMVCMVMAKKSRVRKS